MQGEAAKLLYKRRTALGLTQHEVAQLAGVREYDVSRWERGAVRSLPLAGIHRVCIALGLDLEHVGELMWEDLTGGAGAEPGPAAGRSEAGDEAVEIANEKLAGRRRPKPKPRGSARHLES